MFASGHTPWDFRSSSRYKAIDLPGTVSDMKCRCGGLLQQVRTLIVVQPPKPTHRKKRILKKWMKRWEARVQHLQMVSTHLALTRLPSFRCTTCGSREGFYHAMGRNLIVIQPMPRKEDIPLLLPSNVVLDPLFAEAREEDDDGDGDA